MMKDMKNIGFGSFESISSSLACTLDGTPLNSKLLNESNLIDSWVVINFTIAIIIFLHLGDDLNFTLLKVKANVEIFF